jgi:hypothetical protein
MPMELYSSEAFVRDIVNAISEAEGKPLNIGGNHHQGIDRAYAFQLISDAKRAVEGNAASSAPSPASEAANARTKAIQTFMSKLDRQGATPKAPRRTAKKATTTRKPATRAPVRRRTTAARR